MNNKFKFKLKITGFEMEVEGSREEVEVITSNIGAQLRGMVQPQGINNEDRTFDTDATIISNPSQHLDSPKKKKI